FEAALLDDEGRPLTHTIGPGRDAFFNLTEGQAPVGATGVTISGQRVKLDVSNLVPATGTPPPVKLVFRLVNNDNDTNTKVRIIGGQEEWWSGGRGMVGQGPRLGFTWRGGPTPGWNRGLGFSAGDDRRGKIANIPPPDPAYIGTALAGAQTQVVFPLSDQ